MRASFGGLAALACAPALAAGAELTAGVNPIRKVVTLLSKMQKKVEQEGKDELALYNKFMCYCKNGDGDLAASISAAEEKIPAVNSSIEAGEAKLSGAKSDLKRAQGDRDAANKAMQEATALREKEAATYADFKAEHETNIAAVAKAVMALEKGVAGSFLQTPAAKILEHIVSKSDLAEADQETVTAFLSQSSGYAPQSGEIIGILKQMGDTMAANLKDAIDSEMGSIKTYQGLIAAKKNEVSALTATVESKTKQIGELGVAIVNMKEDVEDTSASLADDKAFFTELQRGCKTKTAEWEERSKTRSEELVALADTVKVLNDDDALDLFKKTLPSASSASFLQMKMHTSSQRNEALGLLRSAQKVANKGDKAGLQLLALTLSGKSSAAGAAGFDKVLKMIDDMVALLGQEQADDDQKKEYCAAQFDASDDKAKALKRSIHADESDIATSQEGISNLAEEIAGLEAGIRALDKAVAEATKQRQDENAEYKSSMAANGAAKEVLKFAKNRLNKFYNPKLHKAAPKAELSEEDRIFKAEGGEVTTAAPGGIANTGISAAFVQVSMHAQRASPGLPPASWDAYAKKAQESGGVISMVDLLIRDLDKEMTEAETDEKNSQADYETMMQDSAAKRTTDSNGLGQRVATKADTEAALQDTTGHLADEQKELKATEKYIASLHEECDWLLQYFSARKQARAGEVDSLKKARAVLSGADNSFLQIRRQSFLSRKA